jgi:hypothetical protein
MKRPRNPFNRKSGETTTNTAAKPIPTEVIVALIGIATTMMTAFFIPSVVGRFFYPIVEVVYDDANLPMTHHQVITLTNYGFEPATNLTLLFKAPSKLVSITNQFSTVDVKVKQLQGIELPIGKHVNLASLPNGTNYIELQAEKLIQGKGSKIVLDIEDAGQPGEYEIAAVYDQGSTAGIKKGAWTIKGFVDNITDPAYFITIAIVTAAAIIIIYRMHKLILKRAKKDA